MNATMKPILAALTLAVTTALAPLQAHAQAYPAKPIRMVIPYPPGGPTDVMGRLVATRLPEVLGQNVVVDNKPGASGQIGAGEVARGAPDGYTLLANASIQVINPHVYAKPLNDAMKDFVPVAIIATVPLVLVVPPSQSVKNVKELAAWFKTRPGNFASSSIASAPHLAGEHFKLLTGTDLQHVAYKGSAPALTDLAGGQVQLMFDSLPSAMPFIRGNKLRALAISSPRRVAALPDTPTMIEEGYPGFDLGTWYAIYAPAGTPREVLGRLNAAVTKLTGSPELRERIGALGSEPATLGLEESAAFNRSEFERWGGIVRAARVKLD